MKPPAFDYVAPTTVAEAVAELSRYNGEARPLSGGQSLVPMLNFRLAAPAVLVDLSHIATLSGVSISSSTVGLGAMTRTARLLERDVEQVCPVLTAAARLVAHPQIRSRGTVGGSIANADPAAELPAVALLTGASVLLAGPRGERIVPASAFFKGTFTTACGWDEIVIGVDFPSTSTRAGWGFREFARRPGDFAVAGAGTILTVENGFISSIVIVVFGVGPSPVRMAKTERDLLGKPPSVATSREIRRVVEDEMVPDDSMFASSHYKRQVAGVLFEQALSDAIRRAGGVAANGIGPWAS